MENPKAPCKKSEILLALEQAILALRCGKDGQAALEYCERVLADYSAKDRGMLVLSRRFGEGIVIDGMVIVKIDDKPGHAVKCVIFAPKAVQIDRLECSDLKLPERKSP